MIIDAGRKSQNRSAIQNGVKKHGARKHRGAVHQEPGPGLQHAFAGDVIRVDGQAAGGDDQVAPQ